MAPSLSVVVCTRDRCALLARALAALDRALGGLDAELIVVDNGSTDGTAALLARHADRPGLRPLHAPEIGLSRARNVGVAAARGPIVAFTDDDCWPRPDWARRLLASFGRDVDAVGGRVLPDVPAAVPWWMRRLRGPLVLHDRGPAPRFYHAGEPAFIGANMAFTRTCLARFGPFREDLGRGSPYLGEDSEYRRRLRAGGARLFYAADAVVFHRVDPARMRLGYAWGWYGRKAREWLHLRRGGGAARG